MRPPRLLLVAAAAATCGCGLYTTTKSGDVGDTLSAGGLRVTVIEFGDEVPRRPGRDYSGLGTPSHGQRFLAVDVKVCNDRGRAIGTYDFAMKLEGGGTAKVRFPQTVYSDGFKSVRDGCERGWILFEAPRGSAAKTLTFTYDDSGSAGPGGNQEKHAQFSWDLT